MSKQRIVLIFSVIFFFGCDQSQRAQSEIIVKEGMVWIPRGVFQMGGNSEEARKDEYQQHPVQVDGFWMDQTEVTNEITQTFGYFELNAIDQMALANFLKSLPQAKEVKLENNLVKLNLNAELSEEELSKKLAKAKIFATHFVKKHPSLEQQFLTLTKAQ